MKIKQVSLAWITVSDIKKAQDFFCNTLGLQITQDSSAEHGWLELIGHDGGGVLGIAQDQDAPIKPGQNAILTFLVDDIISAHTELKEKGVSLIGDIIEIPGHVKMATFTDPDNNYFQLVQQIG